LKRGAARVARFLRIYAGYALERKHKEAEDVAHELKGKKIAFLAADGVEQVELMEPWKAVESADGEPELLSIQGGKIQAFDHLDKGEEFRVDKHVSQAEPDDYDGLVLPGGVANPDFLRGDEDAVRFVQRFFETGKPIGVICHGPWTLVEAEVVKGRKLTSWPTVRTDIVNAGGEWVDQEVVIDGGLISSRKPDDLPAFCAALIEELGDAEQADQAEPAAEASRA
jgi:deglycase